MDPTHPSMSCSGFSAFARNNLATVGNTKPQALNPNPNKTEKRPLFRNSSPSSVSIQRGPIADLLGLYPG